MQIKCVWDLCCEGKGRDDVRMAEWQTVPDVVYGGLKAVSFTVTFDVIPQIDTILTDNQYWKTEGWQPL